MTRAHQRAWPAPLAGTPDHPLVPPSNTPPLEQSPLTASPGDGPFDLFWAFRHSGTGPAPCLLDTDTDNDTAPALALTQTL